MFGIGAWRRPWIVAGLVGWAAAMAVHVAAMYGVDFPTAVGWVLFIGIFPPFFVAGFTHPRAVVRGLRARLGPIDAITGAWPPYIALGLGSLVYLIVICAIVGVHDVSMNHHLTVPEMQTSSALSACFFALSTMVQSSARAAETIGFDVEP